jgi:hypothetical protein
MRDNVIGAATGDGENSTTPACSVRHGCLNLIDRFVVPGRCSKVACGLLPARVLLQIPLRRPVMWRVPADVPIALN